MLHLVIILVSMWGYSFSPLVRLDCKISADPAVNVDQCSILYK